VTDADRRPSRHGTRIAVVVGAGAVVALGALSPGAAVVAGLGWACLLVGVVRSSRRLVTAWLVALWLGSLVGATGAVPPLPTALVVLTGVVAWDAGQRAVGLGRTLTRNAESRRVETLHAGATAAVGGATLTVAYGTYVLAPAASSGAAVLALAVAVTGLLYAIERVRGGP